MAIFDEPEDTIPPQETLPPVSDPKSILDRLSALKANPTQNPTSTKDLISKLLGNGDDKELEDAKSKRDSLRLMATLSQAGSTLGDAFTPLAKHKDDSAYYKNLMEQSNQPILDVQAKNDKAIQDLKTKALADQLDPTTASAKAAKQILDQTSKNAGLTIDPANLEGTTLATAEQLGKSVDSMSNLRDRLANAKSMQEARTQGTKDAAQIRADALKAQNQMRADAKKAAQDAKDAQVATKQDQMDEKTQGEIAKRLNGLSSSSRSALGKAAQANVSIDRVNDIINDPNASPQDLQSVAADMNVIISGASTISGAEHQAYNTLASDFAKGLSYITGNPAAPDLPQVKKHIADVAGRMKKIGNDVIKQNAKIVGSGYSKWIERHPDDWDNMIGSASGGEESTASTSPSATAKAPNAHPQDSEAVIWAKAHPTDPRAAAILKVNGI